MWSKINSGCDNMDTSIRSFRTNSSGYAFVNLTRIDGSNVNVGVYTLCDVSSSGNTFTGLTYTNVDTITVVPLLHYDVNGQTFIANVSSTVYLLNDLSVDKLKANFTQ